MQQEWHLQSGSKDQGKDEAEHEREVRSDR